MSRDLVLGALVLLGVCGTLRGCYAEGREAERRVRAEQRMEVAVRTERQAKALEREAAHREAMWRDSADALDARLLRERVGATEAVQRWRSLAGRYRDADSADTIYVDSIVRAGDEVVQACSLALFTCERTIAARDSVIAAQDSVELALRTQLEAAFERADAAESLVPSTWDKVRSHGVTAVLGAAAGALLVLFGT